MKALLIQARDPEDPMKIQEVHCFCERSGIPAENLRTANAVENEPIQIQQADIILIGGSGQYSATEDLPWMQPVLDSIHEARAKQKPLFGSCWGFHMIARAFGGSVITDEQKTELGTLPISLTDQAMHDPVFRDLPNTFLAQLGHKDNVKKLPDDAILMASSAMHRNQAFRIADTQIYATQFHPELTANDMRVRLQHYIDCGYVAEEEKPRLEQILAGFLDTPFSNSILRKFMQHLGL